MEIQQATPTRARYRRRPQSIDQVEEYLATSLELGLAKAFDLSDAQPSTRSFEARLRTARSSTLSARSPRPYSAGLTCLPLIYLLEGIAFFLYILPCSVSLTF